MRGGAGKWLVYGGELLRKALKQITGGYAVNPGKKEGA